MLFIKELNTELNTQKDAIRDKLRLYVTLRTNTLLSSHIFAFICVS